MHTGMPVFIPVTPVPVSYCTVWWDRVRKIVRGSVSCFNNNHRRIFNSLALLRTYIDYIPAYQVHIRRSNSIAVLSIATAKTQSTPTACAETEELVLPTERNNYVANLYSTLACDVLRYLPITTDQGIYVVVVSWACLTLLYHTMLLKNLTYYDGKTTTGTSTDIQIRICNQKSLACYQRSYLVELVIPASSDSANPTESR
jgi:hypothetical protein